MVDKQDDKTLSLPLMTPAFIAAFNAFARASNEEKPAAILALLRTQEEKPA
jgi:hypothetical protein